MKKIIVGISGGVDSSVAALLLKQQGYHVEGMFMKNWEDDDDAEYCTAAQDFADAQAVCTKIGIPLHAVNFAKDYWDRVFSHFLDEYQAGRTPNPDVMCNKEIKFKAFLDEAMKHNADYIATGHYVKGRKIGDEFQLCKAIDHNKDQSYFLYLLNQHQLSKSLFPLGEYEKPDVRKIAEENGLVTHSKKDSTGICFIGERRFKDFLQQYLPAKPGVIKTLDGETIGKHDGLMYYTIGQRQGLGIGGLKDSNEEPWYVVGKDLGNNTLLVTQGHRHPALLKENLTANQVHWIAGKAPELPLKCTAKTRYRQADQQCIVHQVDEDTINVEFEEPQRAITPGQALVLYQDDVCLGGATII